MYVRTTVCNVLQYVSFCVLYSTYSTYLYSCTCTTTSYQLPVSIQVHIFCTVWQYDRVLQFSRFSSSPGSRVLQVLDELRITLQYGLMAYGL